MIIKALTFIQKRLPLFPSSVWKLLFWTFAAVLLITMPWLSRLYGITFDEWMDSNNAMLTLRNILSGGKDMEFMGFWWGYLYSQFFYTVVGMLYGLFLDNLWRISHNGLLDIRQMLPFYTFSHFINALFGFWAMLTTGLLAKKMAGWRAAFIALVFIALSPRFFGNSMNDPKDIPFAATFIFSLYHMAFFLEKLPEISKRNCLMTALATGLCIGSRLGGFILPAYLVFLSAVILIPIAAQSALSRKMLLRVAAALFMIIFLSIAIAFIFWPYGRTHSVFETLEAILKMSKFEYWDGEMLFEGKLTVASKMPWYYALKWILISSPLFFPAGLLLLFLKQKTNAGHGRTLMLLVLAGLFPLVFILIRKSIIYDSWRHLFFIYPPLVILSALGWERLCLLTSSRWKKIAVGTMLILFCCEPLTWILRNPTYSHVYFNPTVGGLKGAFTKYDSDYWGSCIQESARWLADYHKKNYKVFPGAFVATNSHVMQSYPVLKKELGQYYQPFGYPPDFLRTSPYTFRSWGNILQRDWAWNYAILMSRNHTPEELGTSWPPKGTLHTVQVDGVPLCAVVKNDEFYEHLAKAQNKSKSSAA